MKTNSIDDLDSMVFDGSDGVVTPKRDINMFKMNGDMNKTYSQSNTKTEKTNKYAVDAWTIDPTQDLESDLKEPA